MIKNYTAQMAGGGGREKGGVIKGVSMIDGLDISVGTFSKTDKVRKKNQILTFNVYKILKINN